jgi:hypothetical protein
MAWRIPISFRRENRVMYRSILVKLQRLFILCLTLALAISIQAGTKEEKDPSGLRPPAWYTDAEIGASWNHFTGRYIFEKSCTSCHSWGPGYQTRSKWKAYLQDFPENHEPDVTKAYADLTGMFPPANYVPNAAQRKNTLEKFLLQAAPESDLPQAQRMASFESLPKVGDQAPDFEIVDVEGHRHKVSEYRGKKQLALVFSRAHW